MSEETIKAINNLAEAINNYTKEMRRQDPNRLLTIAEVAEEYSTNEQTVAKKIFNNPNVITNRLNMNKVIKNTELWKYFDREN